MTSYLPVDKYAQAVSVDYGGLGDVQKCTINSQYSPNAHCELHIRLVERLEQQRRGKSDMDRGREARKLMLGARDDLAVILPPQSDKLIRALQNIDRALHYFELDGCGHDGLDALRTSLITLNQIEKPFELPPNVRLIRSKVLGALVRALRLVESERVEDGNQDHVPGLASQPIVSPETAHLSVDDTTINRFVGNGEDSSSALRLKSRSA